MFNPPPAHGIPDSPCCGRRVSPLERQLLQANLTGPHLIRPPMLIASHTLLLQYREGVAVLASSAAFLIGALLFWALS
jgi:hypothetical protein